MPGFCALQLEFKAIEPGPCRLPTCPQPGTSWRSWCSTCPCPSSAATCHSWGECCASCWRLRFDLRAGLAAPRPCGMSLTAGGRLASCRQAAARVARVAHPAAAPAAPHPSPAAPLLDPSILQLLLCGQRHWAGREPGHWLHRQVGSQLQRCCAPPPFPSATCPFCSARSSPCILCCPPPATSHASCLRTAMLHLLRPHLPPTISRLQLGQPVQQGRADQAGAHPAVLLRHDRHTGALLAPACAANRWACRDLLCAGTPRLGC